MSAGLASRVETQGSNEDEEGLSEPAEMAEFLNELGEGDSRCLLLYPLSSSLPNVSTSIHESANTAIDRVLEHRQACSYLSACLSVRLLCSFDALIACLLQLILQNFGAKSCWYTEVVQSSMCVQQPPAHDTLKRP